MQAVTMYLLLLIAVPTLGGLACLTRKRGTSPWMVVGGTTAFTIVLALSLLGYMSINHLTSFSVNGNDVFPMEWIILGLDFVLMAYFVYAEIQDPFVAVTGYQTAGGNLIYLWIRDTQPQISGASFKYFLVHFDPVSHEIDQLIPSNAVEVP